MQATTTAVLLLVGACMAFAPNAGYAISSNALPAAARVAIGHHPNLTHAVSFPFDGTDGSWTWRVNVTDLAVPNIGIEGLGHDNQTGDYSFSDGTRTILTQWDLQWPGAGGLEDYLYSHGGINVSLCYTSMALLFPPNVTKNYNSDAGNGDCTGLLGQECTTAVVNALSSMRSCSQGLSSIFQLDACQSTLNIGNENFTASHPQGETATTGGTTASKPNGTADAIQSGDAVYAWGFYTNGSDPTAFEHVKGTANILGLTKLVGTSSSEAKLVCQVLDKNAATTAAAASTKSSDGHANVAAGMVWVLPLVGLSLSMLGFM